MCKSMEISHLYCLVHLQIQCDVQLTKKYLVVCYAGVHPHRLVLDNVLLSNNHSQAFYEILTNFSFLIIIIVTIIMKVIRYIFI